MFKLIFSWCVVALIIAIVLIFAFQNQAQTCTLYFLKWQTVSTPVYISLFIAYALGVFSFILFAVAHLIRINSKLSKERKEHIKFKEEYENLQRIYEQAQEELKMSEYELMKAEAKIKSELSLKSNGSDDSSTEESGSKE